MIFVFISCIGIYQYNVLIELNNRTTTSELQKVMLIANSGILVILYLFFISTVVADDS